jgi:dipeptide/tripeptide permease
MGLLAAGGFLLAGLGLQSSVTSVALALALAGLGTGTFISPNSSALMGSAPGHRQGIAAGVLATARSFGMVVGVGISGAIFTTSLAGGQAAGATAPLFGAFSVALLSVAAVAAVGVLVAAAGDRARIAPAAPAPDPGQRD